MNNALKTSIVASMALAVSFVLLFAYLDLFGTINQTNVNAEKLDASSFNGENRILLLGSSYVERLNATYIKQYLSANGLQQFEVYNIAKNGAGNPSQQIENLDSIVSAHPRVIVYGLGFRELGYKPYTDNIPKCALTDYTSYINKTNNSSFSTPSVTDAVEYIQKITPLKSDYFSNIPDPKHVTINLLRTFFEENQTSVIENGPMPGQLNDSLFEKRGPLFTEIKSLNEINRPLGYVVRVCPVDMQNELADLDKMVTIFKQNTVKVILFVPPFSKSYLNAVGDDGIKIFSSELQQFSNENGLPLYDLHDKYVDLNIWADAQHVAQNPKVVIYSDDLAKIIQKELQSFTYLRIVDTSKENLSNEDLSYADLRNVDLSNKNMTGVSLVYSNLYGAKINGTILKDADLSNAYLRNLDLSGKDLSGTLLVNADLTNANLSGVDLSGKDLSGTNLSGVDLSGKDLSGTNLSGTNLANANLSGVDLSGKDLSGTNLSGVDLSGKDLSGTNLSGTNLAYADLRGVDLTNKNLTGTNLKGVYLSHMNLTGTILTGATLANANLRDDDLSGKNLTGTFLHTTNFYGANLSGVDLSGVNLRKTVLINTNLINAKLQDVDLATNNFTGTTLIGADLHNAQLWGVDLSGKNLTGTNLTGANLKNSNLSGVDLSGKDLSGTNLMGVNLDKSNLSGINLGLKNFTGASMRYADLSEVNFWKTQLINVDLSGATLSKTDLHNTILKNTNLTNADLSGTNLSGNDLTKTVLIGANLTNADLSGANLSGNDLTKTVLIGTNLHDANLSDVIYSGERLSGITPTKAVSNDSINAGSNMKIIDNFQSDNGWLKQSPDGFQSYDHVDFINGTQSLKLVTAGNGSPVFTRSQMFSPTLNLNNYTITTWVKIDDISKVREMWFYFTSDNFKSSWYTYKVPMSKEIKSGQWLMISFNLENSTSTGVPDISSIDRIQIRIADDSTGPVTLHVNEISVRDKKLK